MYVFGNGESRTSININNIHLPTVGCNAIVRDYLVDYLVCADKRMVMEAIGRAYKKIHLYTHAGAIGYNLGLKRT